MLIELVVLSNCFYHATFKKRIFNLEEQSLSLKNSPSFERAFLKVLI